MKLRKDCPKCGLNLPAINFRKVDKSACKSCLATASREDYHADPAKSRKYHREWQKSNPERKNAWLKSSYGITIGEYREMLVEQKHVCAICFSPEMTKKSATGELRQLSVDHCHKTGKIRGLLCRRCNLADGNLDSNIERVKSLLAYLERHNAET